MKLPKPGDPPPTAHKKLYVSLIGDIEEIDDEIISCTIYNYDNPSDNVLLVVLTFRRSFACVSATMPCCGGTGEVNMVQETFADDTIEEGYVVRCLQCDKTFCPLDLHCEQDRTIPHLKRFPVFKHHGRIYLMHHDKHLGLSPHAAYESNINDHLRYRKQQQHVDDRYQRRKLKRLKRRAAKNKVIAQQPHQNQPQNHPIDRRLFRCN